MHTLFIFAMISVDEPNFRESMVFDPYYKAFVV